MIEETNFETYLFVSRNRCQIFVFDINKLKNIFWEELKFNNEFNFKDLNDLSKFLDENIYKIEKLVGSFIKNIILIIEKDENLNINISIKKKNYKNSINQKYLETNLIELKDIFKENYQELGIMHMVIDNYVVDGKEQYSLVSNLTCDHFSLEVNFVSISNNLTLIFDKLLEKYQIKISQYMCGYYIKNFFRENDDELSLKAHRLKNGANNNEVILVPKNIDNKGFFEKFFQLFS